MVATGLQNEEGPPFFTPCGSVATHDTSAYAVRSHKRQRQPRCARVRLAPPNRRSAVKYQDSVDQIRLGCKGTYIRHERMIRVQTPPIWAAMTTSVSDIRLEHRVVGTKHVYTSPDVPGLHVSHSERETAFQSVQQALDMMDSMRARIDAKNALRSIQSERLYA